jgi:hypothetical protein
VHAEVIFSKLADFTYTAAQILLRYAQILAAYKRTGALLVKIKIKTEITQNSSHGLQTGRVGWWPVQMQKLNYHKNILD